MIILDKGTLLYNGTLQELKNSYRNSYQAELYQYTTIENNLENIIRNIYEGDFL